MERVWQRQYAKHAVAKADITGYIVGFYNCKRINSALNNLPPPSTNGKWQHANLSGYPKLLDHSKHVQVSANNRQFPIMYTAS